MFVVLAIGVHVVNGDTEDSQRITLPVSPLKVSVGAVLPEQMAEPPVTVPPTAAGVTVTVVEPELAEAHDPLCTTARNCVVAVIVPVTNVLVVLLMVVHVVNGDTDDSHLTTLPVSPLRVSVPPVEPEQIVDPPVTDPPVLGGLTVMVVDVEVADAQAPFCTTARYCVVADSAPTFSEVVVLAIGVHEVNGATDDSQFTTFPLEPFSVSVPPVEPEQIVLPPVTEPATVADETLTVNTAELAAVQLPL